MKFYLVKNYFFVFIIFFSFYPLYSERPRVQEKELQGAKKVQFFNRANSRANSKLIQEQEELGRKLAKMVESNPNIPHRLKGIEVKRYASEKSGFMGADILSLGNEVNYGHFHSLKRLLASYIQNAFEFSESNADTIALFALYYNAIHRNQKSYFRDKYSPNVVNELDVEKVGLSQYYNDWPNNTQLVIPIDYNQISKREEISLEEIAKDVKELPEIKPEDKKKMEEIIIEKKKETQNIPDTRTIQGKSESITKEEIPKKTNPEIIREAKQETVPSVKEVVTSSKTEMKEENRPEFGKKTEITEKPKQEESTYALLPKKEEPAPTPKERELEKKIEQLKKENEDLKIKEKEKEEKSENIIGDKVLFLRLVKYEDDGHYTNELWVLDASNEQTLYKSPYTNICGKEFHVIKEGVVVIGFDGNRPVERVHRLVLLDQEKLSQVKVTKEEIFWRSHIVYKDGKIYAFEKYKNDVYLSRFNPDLTLDARSSEPVGTNSELSFYKDRIFLTGKPGNEEETVIRILQKQDLKVVKTLKPIENRRRAK